MAKQVIDIGTTKNDGSGDTLRVGAQKINDNFSELYNALGATSGQLSLVSQLRAGDGIELSAGTGNILVSNARATTISLGGIIVGDNLTIDNDGVLSAVPGSYVLPIATGGTLGGIKIGNTLTISETGVVNVVNDLYTLPTASSSTLGGVKVGARLTITNGVLSADVQTIPTATTSVKGGVIVDGITIGINGSGVISVLSSGASLNNGDHSFTLNSDGTLSLDGELFTGGGANTGNIAFDVGGDIAGIYNSTGSGVIISNLSYLTAEAETAWISIPPGNTAESLKVVQEQGDVEIWANGNTWTFDNVGHLVLPSAGALRINNSWNKVSISNLINTDTSNIVWSSTYDYISSVKLTIQLETEEIGDATGWHSQVCEAVIAARGYANSFAGPGGDPVMTVYGVTYTSTVPLATFTVQRNATTKIIELVATRTAATDTNISFRIHSVEMATRD